MKKNIVGGIVTKPKLLFICLLVLTLLPISAYAVTVDLGTAANFGALGGSKVTNTGFTIINGDVGVWPGTSITGFPPGIATGTIHTGDSVAGTAQADLLTAYNIAAGAPGGSPGPGELGGATLLPGVYTYGSSAPWTFGAGDLTLDANGDSSAQWIFQIGTTLITPADAKVVLIRGASANNVFWQVGTSATLGATNTFAGNILADQSITLGGGALNGRALAMNAKVEISVAETITPTAADSNLHIRIWYGPNQVFAQQGTPQRWINILGDIINPARVQSLTYSLNGGPQLPLSMGPPNPRLAGEGDLNVELACVDVNLLHAPTQNNIVITATDLNDHATTASVNCEYFNMNSWRLPYDINWSTVMDSNLADSNIFNAVQIVDGQWTVEPNGLSTVVEGYNRSFAIGDMNNWRDYEVNVPITVHQSYHDGNQPAVGLVMRWTGYYPDANDNNQPVSGNHPIGAAALFKWSDDSNGKYTIYNHDFNVVGEANSPGGTLLPEATYILKMRVETIPDTGGLYSFKVWESNQPEPNTWLLQRQEDLNDPQNGSVLLLAHHVDATFGNITVINTAPLFTIGGRVQDTNGALIGGVTINGLPGNPVTDINGLYTAIVSDGWTWSVAPAKTGYIFDPPSRSYTDVNVNYNSENYYTGTLTFTISGNAGVNGVTMSGLPGNPVTDINGLYTAAVPHGWSGTATPTKTGYTFTPTNRSYADVNAASNSQNYTSSQITFTISGNADENGVTMSGLPGNPVTDINGLYSATVPYGWSGTVTPAKTGYTFTPTNRSYTSVTAASNSQNYTSSQITFTISGNADENGVTMSGLPGNPVTDINGLYTAAVPHGWNGTVTPAKTGYTFTPTNRSYADVNADSNSQNYTASQITFTISGNAGVNGVTMSGLPGNPVTDINGLYTAAVPHGWSGTATPTKTGYTFTPTNRSYADVNADSNSQNYTASQITFTISGNADENGVTMSGLPGNPVTDINGLYTATVPYGWSGTVTPAKTGYTFTPTSRSYADVNADSNNQNYTASQNTMTIKQFTITAGTTTTVSKDGFVINGTFDANLQDIAGSTAIYIRLSNASELVFEGVIPYNSDRLKNGRYSYTRRDNAPDTIRIVLFDLNKKTFHILAKRASLTGLSCPVNVELEWGRYIGHAQADETIVNGKKPIPMVLLSGYADALRVDKASVNTNTKKANRDSLTVQGAIAFKSTAENLKQHSLTLHWGDQDFNVPAGEFVASTHGRYTYKSPRGTVIEIKNASFDLEKCTFTFSVKNATIASRTGTVVCRITCDTFDQSVAYPLR